MQNENREMGAHSFLEGTGYRRRFFRKLARDTRKEARRCKGETCMVCLDPLTDQTNIVSTVCDHFFHGICWARYVQTRIMDEFDHCYLDADRIRDCFILTHAGPPCPLCRRDYPMVHRFAYALQDDFFIQPVKWLEGNRATLDHSLALAQSRRV